MKTTSKTKLNLILQTLYQILNTCLPLITAPFLSRRLGATQLGVFSYVSSVSSYFALFAMLGIINYGTRSIAACGNDRKKRSDTFWNIYLMQAGLACICTIIYILYITLFVKENTLLFVIQALYVFSCALNINWLYFGVEDFKLSVLRNSIVRVASVILILVLIKDPDDLWIYALIIAGSELISQLIMWIQVPKVVGRGKVRIGTIISNIKPNIVLFLPLLAMSIYHIMDKTMLGTLSTYDQSGYYYNADKVVNVTMGVISGISTVMLPRMTSLISEGKKKESDDLFRLSLEGTAVAGIAMAFGIAAIANEFEPIFFGPGYDECILLTIVLAPVLIIKSFSFTARYQYLIPHHKEKSYTVSVVLGAIVNLIANMMLIPRLGAMGAVIGTLLAELVACLWQFIAIRTMISLKTTIARCIVYFLFGLLMFSGVRMVALLDMNIYIKVFIEVIVGILIYLLTCMIYWKITGNNIRHVMFGRFLHKGTLR